MHLKKLLRRLAKGVPYPHPRTMQRKPEIVQRHAVAANLDMKEAAKLLQEAHEIIVGLTCDTTTFGHHEAALNWTHKYNRQ